MLGRPLFMFVIVVYMLMILLSPILEPQNELKLVEAHQEAETTTRSLIVKLLNLSEEPEDKEETVAAAAYDDEDDHDRDDLQESTTTTNYNSNNSNNGNNSGNSQSQGGPAEQDPSYMQHMTTILVCLHLSVFISGLVGNSLVCLSVLRNKSLQTVTNYYIVNLAVADFLVILICLPPTVYWDIKLTWNFGLILCKLVLYLQSISVSVSVLTLTCISIDRWYAICRPLEFSSTKYRAKITICFIWLASMLIASPDAIFLTTKSLYEEDDYVYTDCTYSWPESNTKIYQLCIVTLLFVGPFVLMSISYSHIVNVLWRNEMSAAIQSADESATAAAAASSAVGFVSINDNGNMPSTSTTTPAMAVAVALKRHANGSGNSGDIGKSKRTRKKKWGGNDNENDNDNDNNSNNFNINFNEIEVKGKGKGKVEDEDDDDNVETNNKHQSMTAAVAAASGKTSGEQKEKMEAEETKKRKKTKKKPIAAGESNCAVVVVVPPDDGTFCRNNWPEQRGQQVSVDQQESLNQQFNLKQAANKHKQQQQRIAASEIACSQQPLAMANCKNLDSNLDNNNNSNNNDNEFTDSKEERPTGNELGNCLVFVSESDVTIVSEVAATQLEIQQKQQQLKKSPLEKKLIRNHCDDHDDGKSLCVQLSYSNTKPTMTTKGESKAIGHDDDGCDDDNNNNNNAGEMAKGRPPPPIGEPTTTMKNLEHQMIGGPGPKDQIGSSAEIVDDNKNNNINCIMKPEQVKKEMKSSGSDERLRSRVVSSYCCCCCSGLLPCTRLGLVSSLAGRHEDHNGESFNLLAANKHQQAAAAAAGPGNSKTSNASIIKDGTTSKKYRRNLANYAAKRDKYRPSTSNRSQTEKVSSAAAKSKLLPSSSPPLAATTTTTSQFELNAANSCKGNENNGNLSTTKRSYDNSQNNLHSTADGQQQQQQSPNYLSSSSNNNARFYKLIESRKKAAKMLIVIVIMFGLCYLPVHFLNILRYTIGLPQNNITTIASLVSHWLCYFNSAINPLIYNLMSGKFRKEFANLFFCRCFRRQ